MSGHYLLIITALRAGEESDLAGAEGGDDGGLVPIEDVTALLAPLAESDDRAPLVDYQASLHLYCHASRPSEDLPIDHRDTEAIVPELRLLPAAGEHLPIRSIDWRTRPLAPLIRGSINFRTHQYGLERTQANS